LLVEEGLAQYVTNPAHRRAKLVRPTDEGYAAVKRITPGHAELAQQLAEELGEKQVELTLDVVTRLSAAMDAVTGRRDA
jgi:DNA-binding MarR family transcriptional regulator